MAKKKIVNGKNGLSGETTFVQLFYDGEKYKDPLYVGINGMNWLIQRGVMVEVPVEVAEVIRNQEAQDHKTADMIKALEKQAQEVLS